MVKFITKFLEWKKLNPNNYINRLLLIEVLFVLAMGFGSVLFENRMDHTHSSSVIAADTRVMMMVRNVLPTEAQIKYFNVFHVAFYGRAFVIKLKNGSSSVEKLQGDDWKIEKKGDKEYEISKDNLRGYVTDDNEETTIVIAKSENLWHKLSLLWYKLVY